MLSAEEVSQMSTPEKLEVLDLIMNSFGNDGSEMPSPDWHEEVLSERMRKIDSGEAKWLSFDEVKRELSELS